MRIAFVVNSPRSQRSTYTTAHLALSAYRRGHEVLWIGVDEFSCLDPRRVFAVGARLPLGHYPTTVELVSALRNGGERAEVDLARFDAVFLRNNPAETANSPVRGNPALDFAYQLRELGVLVINDPRGIAAAHSKLYLSRFPQEIRPRTLVTRSESKAKQFLRELDGPAIIKPLEGFGGESVFYVRRGQIANVNQMLSAARRDGYLIAQEFLPAVTKGDKRLLLWRGEPIPLGEGRVAMYRRMRPKDDIRNNIHVGGQRRRAEFTEVEKRLAEQLKPRLLADGLLLVGVDIVGDKILEVNVLAPGGIHNINELYQADVGGYIIDDLARWVEERREARQAAESAPSSSSPSASSPAPLPLLR